MQSVKVCVCERERGGPYRVRIPDSDSKDTKSHQVNAVNWINVFASFSHKSFKFQMGFRWNYICIRCAAFFSLFFYDNTEKIMMQVKYQQYSSFFRSRYVGTFFISAWIAARRTHVDLELHLWFTRCKEMKILDKITYSVCVLLVSDNRKIYFSGNVFFLLLHNTF